MSVGQRKIFNPHEEPRSLESMLQCSTTKPQRLYGQGSLQNSHMTSIQYSILLGSAMSIALS